MPEYQPLTPEERARVERLLAAAEQRKTNRNANKRSSHGTVDADGNPVKWEAPDRQLKGASATFYTRDTTPATRAIDAIKNAPYTSWKPTPRDYGKPTGFNAPNIIVRATEEGQRAALAASDDLSILDIAILGACFDRYRSPNQLVMLVRELRSNPYIRALRIFQRVPRLVDFDFIDVGPKVLPPTKHQRRSR